MSKILVIDDDNFICEILKKHLQNHKYEVQVAFSGKKAEQIISKSKFDLILCDFRLPDTSGLELLRKIRTIKQDIPVVIMTAYADVRMAVKLMKMGASDYITKPIQHEELLSIINKLINEKKRPGSSVPNSPYTNGDFIIGDSEKIKHVIKLARRVAPTNMSVIIGGETGIGKEYIARFIHENSLRKNKPFVAIDCGAIQKDLANSVLFGHVKGSFTGAIADRDGVFQKAHGGTLFLDEIGNLSYEVQQNLLRAIQERVVSRLGDDKLVQNDIRIIAAGNDNFYTALRENTFREDLYHRLNEFKIDIPPLRERPEDIEIFVKHFISMANVELSRHITGLTSEAKKIVMDYSWYGNLRELKNVIKRAVLMADGDKIDQYCFPEEIIYPQNETNGSETTEMKSDSMLKNASYEIEKQLILKTIREAGFNKSKAARILNIDRKTLYNKLKLYEIKL